MLNIYLHLQFFETIVSSMFQDLSSRLSNYNNYIDTIKSFKGIHNINISEKRNLSDSTKDFWEVFNVSESPRTSKKLGKESATTETSMYDEQLRKKILNAKKYNLTPSDIIKYSLEITKGDYQKAVLSAHNVFKSVCYDLREAQNNKDNLNIFIDSKSKNYSMDKLKPNTFNDDLKIVGKLSNLRENSSKNNDKMGMWYHFFGVQSMCSRNGIGKSYLAIAGEHSARIFKYFHLIFKNSSTQWSG